MFKTEGKINYELLKKDYFISEYKSFNAYYKELRKVNRIPSNVQKKVKGWAKEKKEFQQNALIGAVKGVQAELKASIRPQMEELENKLANVLKLVDLKIKSMYENAFEVRYNKFGEVMYKEDEKGNYLLDKDGAKIPMQKLGTNINATEINRLYDIIKTELGEPAKIHNSRLGDGEGGLELPQITGMEVEIIKTQVTRVKT